MTTITLPEKVTFKHGGFTRDVETANIPEAMLVMLFQYGVTRKANDTLNGEAKKVKDAGQEWYAEDNLIGWTEDLMAGKIGTGSRATDLVEKHLRRLVSGLLQKHLKMTKKAAAEAVRAGAKTVFDSRFKDSGADVWEKLAGLAQKAADIEERAKAEMAELPDINV